MSTGTFAFDAKTAVARHGKAIFQRLLQPAIQCFDEFFLGALSHRLVVAGQTDVHGVSSPNNVMVWKPCARSSGERMLSSVSV